MGFKGIRTVKPYTSGREDLAKIIASETCGIQDAIPEQDDYDLADEFLHKINHRFDEE